MVKHGDILNPSTVFIGVFWFSSVIATLYFHNWTAVSKINPLILAYILLGCIVFLIIDSLCDNASNHSKLYINAGRYVSVSRTGIILLILIDLIVVLAFYRYGRALVGKYGLGSEGSINAAYRSIYGHSDVVIADDRMNPLLRYGTYFLQSSAYVCLFAFIDNVIIYKNKKKQNISLLIPIILFLTYAVLCGTRGDFLKIAISGFAVYYILFLKNGGWKNRNVEKVIKVGIRVLIGVLVLFFMLSIAVGRSAVNGSLLQSFILQISGYAGAPIVHFSQYLYNQTEAITPGEESFYSLFLTLKSRGIGSLNSVKNLEYVRLRGGIYGNVYTFFRRPLHDFGSIGVFVFLIVVAYFICTYYYKYIKYAKYSGKDKFNILLIIYSMIFQSIAYASIDQMSGEFVSLTFLFRIIFAIVIYLCLFCINYKRMKMKIK